MPDQVEILSEAVSRERLPVAPQTLSGGVDVRPVAEEADPAMARREQVLDRGARAARVVGDDRVGVEEARRPVDEHQRHAGRALAQQVRAVVDRAGDDQPVDAARAERLGELALALGLLVGASRPAAARRATRATSSTPRCTAPKNGFETSSKIRPIVADCPSARRSVLAVRLWR